MNKIHSSIVTFTGTITDCNFEGDRFEQGVTCIDAIFIKDANFGRAVFDGYANFAMAEFHGEVNFHGAIFKGGASFEGAKFICNGKGVSFDKASFANEGSVSFYNAKFLNTCKDASFYKASFANEGDVMFYEASFANKGDVSFDGTSFANEGEVSFEEASFANKGDVLFDKARFANKGAVMFDNASFANDGGVLFYKASFDNKGDVLFDKASFANDGGVWFSVANFTNEGGISLDQMIWVNKGDIKFKGVQFNKNKDVRFYESLFLNGGTIYFTGIKTSKDGIFAIQRCHFADVSKIDFSRASFHNAVVEGGEIQWIGEGITTISLPWPLWQVGEMGRIESYETVEKQTIKAQDENKTSSDSDGISIREILNERLKKSLPEWVESRVKELEKQNKDLIPKYTNVFDDGTIVKWQDLSTESAKNLTFTNVSLEGARFDGMTLAHVQLNAPTWLTYDVIKKKEPQQITKGRPAFQWYHYTSDWLSYTLLKNKGRTILSAEKELRALHKDEKDVPLKDARYLGNQYTLLKNNLTKQGDHAQAGDFHYGEQEMRRLDTERPLLQRAFTKLYHLSSCYGERPSQAASIWFVLLMCITVISLSFQALGQVNIGGFFLTENGYWRTVHPATVVKTIAHVLAPPFWNGNNSSAHTVLPIDKETYIYFVILYVFKFILYMQTVLFFGALKRKFIR